MILCSDIIFNETGHVFCAHAPEEKTEEDRAMPEYNGIDPSCPFDVSEYTSRPAPGTAKGRVDVRRILAEADEYYAKNDPAGAEKMLEEQLGIAEELNDREGKLGILNELLGCYRKTGNAEAGLRTAGESTKLVSGLGMEGTVTAGTVYLNAATTMREFGRAEDAVRYYDTAARAYAANLDPGDYRFAGLYNNYAACMEACGNHRSAEDYYKRALAVISRLRDCALEEAVTCVNLACMYGDLDSEDERIEEYLMRAKRLFDREDVPRDGYYAFNAMKCVDAFSHFGFFRDAKELRLRAEEIYGILQKS